MRIKAVLRDNEILNMEAGSSSRITSTAQKNADRLVSLSSLLKVMGLKEEQRVRMLEVLHAESIHIWFANEASQHVIYISKKDTLDEDIMIPMYQWQ